MGKGTLRHGHCVGGRSSPEYIAWQQLIARCTNSKCKSYPRYGGRGIQVCVRWQVNYENFWEDMGPRPGPEYSIERRDNDGPYCPENCIWSTAENQARNRRTTRFVEVSSGVRMCLAEAAEVNGLSPRTLRDRLERGWSVERALSEPVHRYDDRRPRPTASHDARLGA